MAAALGSLAECPICMEEYNSDPKFLPCLHTVCLKCVERLLSSQPRAGVRCPLCREPIDVGMRATDMRTNVHAEELVHLTRDMRAMECDLQFAEDELEYGINEKQLIDTDLADTVARLDELKAQSSQEKQRLKCKVKELERNLSAVQSAVKKKELSLREQQQKTMKELKDASQWQERAEDEAERYRKVSSDLKAMKNQLKLTEVERQHAAAEMRSLEAAATEADDCRKAKSVAEASLATVLKSCQGLQQQLQQTQREKNEYAQMLEKEREQSAQKVEAERYRKVGIDLIAMKNQLNETEVGRQHAVAEKRRLVDELVETRVRLADVVSHYSEEKREIVLRVTALKRDLAAAQSREERLNNQQQETAKQLNDEQHRHQAAATEADDCRKAKSVAEASLATALKSSQGLEQQLQQTKREKNEYGQMLEKEREQSAQTFKRLSGQIAADKVKLTDLKNLLTGGLYVCTL